jgi:hypothetical protein
MTARLVYQPCSEDIAGKNLQTTILNSVSFSAIADLLEPELQSELMTAFPDGKLFIWGLASPRTRNAWLTMEPGDTIIFNTKTVVTVSARFTHRTTNRNLALRLWGWADEAAGSTWENIYFVKDVRHHTISFKDIQKLVESPHNRSFLRYSEAQSSAVFEHFPELAPEYEAGDVSLEEAQEEIQEKQTDGSAVRPTRLEHQYIVNHLFQKQPTGYCCICLNEYPRHLLVAAHIKKRSACSTKEKLDIKNIAAPMCRLGCDPLFEHGYIAVKDGKVIKHPSREMTDAIAGYVQTIVDNPVKWWGRKNRKYFEWHLGAHGFEPGALADAD